MTTLQHEAICPLKLEFPVYEYSDTETKKFGYVDTGQQATSTAGGRRRQQHRTEPKMEKSGLWVYESERLKKAQ